MLSSQIKRGLIRGSAHQTLLTAQNAFIRVAGFNFSEAAPSFYAKDLTIEEREVKLHKPDPDYKYPFGRLFTDHMLTVDWDVNKGWHQPKIVPYGPIPICTTASVLHYGISAYESICFVKNQETGIPQAFRARANLNSLRRATEHLDMPTFDTVELWECLKKFVTLEESWFPDLDYPSQLYCRMTHFSTDETLGVKTPKKTKLIAMINPCTLKPKTFKVKCATNVFKNWPLGHGAFRVSSNFGPLGPVIHDAKNNGYDDVLWLLDGYIKELTVINCFMHWKSRYGQLELITPPNDGCIFNGSVRKAILDLADEIYDETKVKVVERNFSIHEMISAHNEGRLLEFFGGSTTCNILPINRISYKEETLDLKETKFSSYMSQKLTSIMTGSPDHKWVTGIRHSLK